jgi:hypothetical protein
VQEALVGIGDSPLHGVTLMQYSAIQAALVEGFSLDEILRIERIETYDFERADAKWKSRLQQASDPTQPLHSAYREALVMAEDHLNRKITPLDSDASAWATFFAAYTNAPDRLRFLARFQMNANDVSRLQRAWQKQAEKNPELLAKLEHISTSAQLPRIETEPRALRRSLKKPTDGPKQQTPKLPGGKPEITNKHTLRRVETFGLDRYASFRAELQVFPKEAARLRNKYDIESDDIGTALIHEFEVWIQEDPERTRAYRRLHATALERARKIADTTTAEEREKSTQAPPVEIARPDKQPELSLGQTYTPPVNPLPAIVEKTPEVAPVAEKPGSGATQDVEALLAGAALPFSKDFSPPEVAAARAERIANATQGPEKENSQAGGTQDVASILQQASLPFQGSRKPSPTNPGIRPEPPAPTKPPEPAAMPAFPDLSVDQYAALCAERDAAPERTAEVLARYRIPPEATNAFLGVWKSRLANDPGLAAANNQAYARYAAWFAQQRARPQAVSLTLEQYASLSVDLANAPARHAETLARYRLTPEDKIALDKHYQQRFAAEPQFRAAFDAAMRAYGVWLAGQARRR